MTLNGLGRILVWCLFMMFGYIYGEMWWNFDISENLRLIDTTFTSFSDCDSGIKCCARCNMERFCAFAQYSTQGRVCKLTSTHVCGDNESAPKWTVYKRIPVDITDTLAREEASAEAITNTNNAVDGNITSSFTGGLGSSWTMELESVWPIASVSITYERFYAQKLKVNMSGALFEYGGCSVVDNHLYATEECLFRPESACWYNASSINITSEEDWLGLRLYEVKIFS